MHTSNNTTINIDATTSNLSRQTPHPSTTAMNARDGESSRRREHDGGELRQGLDADAFWALGTFLFLFYFTILMRIYIYTVSNAPTSFASMVASSNNHRSTIMRVAVGIHGSDIDKVIEIHNLMSEHYFTHTSPTLFNASTPKPQLSSCFHKDDSIEGIYETLKNCAMISKTAGGIGLRSTTGFVLFMFFPSDYVKEGF